jgi:hypothetical protein
VKTVSKPLTLDHNQIIIIVTNIRTQGMKIHITSNIHNFCLSLLFSQEDDGMKFIRFLFCLIPFLLITLIGTHSALANWRAGAERRIPVDGITALITTPQNPLDLFDAASSGVSNWISTFESDSNGRNWMQAGWKFYWWYSLPKQYVEWCIDCSGSQGTYEMREQFATQNWGTTVDYWVDRGANSRWCASTAGVVRYCVDNLHSTSVEVIAKSEVHDSMKNPMNTIFDQVRYKDPADGVYKLFDYQVLWLKDFPYNVEVFSYSHYRTFRLTTNDIYLPIVVR